MPLALGSGHGTYRIVCQPNQGKHEVRKIRHLLYKAVTLASTCFVLLQLDEFEFTERFKDILEVCFSDTEMDITHV
jgi:hypothetical protein